MYAAENHSSEGNNERFRINKNLFVKTFIYIYLTLYVQARVSFVSAPPVRYMYILRIFLLPVENMALLE